ncbi:MAG: M48 family metallopeptidase [Desulfobacteraceae bacterium]|nr:M48 family metallopeptidase [Desulfobacteraceae bacterium]
MKSETVELEGAGRILFERSNRARNINISVRPFHDVRVAVPFGVSFKRAKEFVCSKKGWIQKHLAKMRQVEQDHRILSQNFNNINRAEARKILVQRLDELAKKHGFKYNRVFVRNQKTRWGSCSSKNNISLNAKLVKLPEKLMDCIILHELVHTRIKNHGKEFYAELGRLVTDQKLLDSELKEYGAGLL